MHRLRGHHLICLHFFKGYDYDEKFRDNLTRILSSISVVEVVDDIDDVCKACPYNKGFCNYSSGSEKEVRTLDEFALKKLGLKVGKRIKWDDLRNKIKEIIEEWKDFACKNCEWQGACNV
ncbi:MAG: DUF1284 domain-containing protein [Archaeoglobi archaeon]|nr:MAG: DUF1284 domain-containing protein [Archaeoglobi archaeon]TDA30206.1 MAG: DUF1284 domain-containing protein [Archaeoglobi archaeon]